VQPQLDLPAYFSLQDEAANGNLTRDARIPPLFSIASEGADLLTTELHEMSFPTEKQTTFRVLGSEVLSSCVIASRVALWGNLAESSACLRPALEAAVMLAHASLERRYATFAYELRSRRLRAFKYESCLKALGKDAGGLGKLHEVLSAFGSHLTASRLQYQGYAWDSESYDRSGFTLDPEAVIRALYFVPVPILSAVHSIQLGTAQEGRLPVRAEARDLLQERYLTVRSAADGSASIAPSSEA